ncbi:peptidylprolyl isomerase [Asticcacaulis sp.]|uniref:peptidylprolyl isomerase n=1 Tax=Asticcacaulis sp. TaxID=1872648 RepID=UPI003F7BC5EE
MKRRNFLSGGSAVLGAALIHRPGRAESSARVALETTSGTIVLALALDQAPITAQNFLRYVDEGRLNEVTFYRAMKRSPEAGLIQGGVGDRALPPIPHEPTSLTGLTHTDGAISLARWAPGTATCEFFIVVGDMTFLDAGKASVGDNQGFAVFGHVTSGMDAVRNIWSSPVSPTEGEGVMKGQMLAPPIPITKAERTV